MSKVPDQAELYRRQAQSALDKLEALKKLAPISTWMGETAEYWYKRWVASYDLANANATKYTVEANSHKMTLNELTRTTTALANAQQMLKEVKKSTFKVGDRIKVNASYDKGRNAGQIGTIKTPQHLLNQATYTTVKMDQKGELLLLQNEMELLQEDLYCGKTAVQWANANDVVVQDLCNAKKASEVWEKRALEAEQKLKDLRALLTLTPSKDVDFNKPFKFSSIPITEYKINLIEDIRETTGWGLKMAKMFAEGADTGDFCYGNGLTASDKEWTVTATHFARLQKVAEKYGVALVQA